MSICVCRVWIRAAFEPLAGSGDPFTIATVGCPFGPIPRPAATGTVSCMLVQTPDLTDRFEISKDKGLSFLDGTSADRRIDFDGMVTLGCKKAIRVQASSRRNQ